MDSCSINLIYGFMMGILAFVVPFALKRLTIRKGIQEIMEENTQKEKIVGKAIEKIEEAKSEIKE